MARLWQADAPLTGGRPRPDRGACCCQLVGLWVDPRTDYRSASLAEAGEVR